LINIGYQWWLISFIIYYWHLINITSYQWCLTNITSYQWFLTNITMFQDYRISVVFNRRLNGWMVTMIWWLMDLSINRLVMNWLWLFVLPKLNRIVSEISSTLIDPLLSWSIQHQPISLINLVIIHLIVTILHID